MREIEICPRFTEAGAAAKSRKNNNKNYLLSMWVYLDDKDTSQNIIYVRLFCYLDDFN